MGSDDDGYAVRLRLRHYLRYATDPAHGAADDSPLYIFDGTFAERRGSRGMRRDYEARARACSLLGTMDCLFGFGQANEVFLWRHASGLHIIRPLASFCCSCGVPCLRGSCGGAQIPEYFREDLMRLAGERRRPPHRSGLMRAHLCDGGLL